MRLLRISGGFASLWKGVLALVVIAAAVAVGTRMLAEGRSRAELPVSQWAGLRDRLVHRVERVQQPAPGPPPAARAPAPPQEWRVPGLPPDPEVLRQQVAEYSAERPKAIIQLQPYRRTTSIEIRGPGDSTGSATLVNLNPTINTWYLLTLAWKAGDEASSYHLANADPARVDIVLDSAYPHGVIFRDSAHGRPCDLWSGTVRESLAQAAAADAPYVSLCDGRVTLRLRTAGHKTSIEKTTDFLRNHVWGGEAITAFVRRRFFQDAFLDTARLLSDSAGAAAPDGAPAPASVDSTAAGSSLAPADLGIAVDGATEGNLAVGRWYGAQGLPGVFVSIVRPDVVSREILTSYPGIVGALDDVERHALAYLIAFDLSRFDVAFALGTDHPRVDWSDRVPATARDESLPGPDGIGTIAPLVSTGIIGPAVVDRVAATFTGGFKRSHGAFKYGPMSLVNHGSHYGFVENGVIFSKLQPGLSTIVVWDDGRLDMRTWTLEDDTTLRRVKFARQNGVPLVTWDTATRSSHPGALVSRWGPGNWSGSQDGRVRALRAGACLQEAGGRRFLIYAYFSTATPGAMARVFQAYRCRYAMLLDMNALEHTYAALYRARDSALEVEHLIRGMSVLDKTVDGLVLPRFLGYADNRDFFYLVWKARAGSGS